MPPFITLYTPTFRRPQGLARCFASVAAQTAVAEIEQIVIPDHLGVGVDGMFARVPQYAEAVHGEYVTFLCDDDVLVHPDVVALVRDFARAHDNPPLILVGTHKGPHIWPQGNPWPPQLGSIDLNCGIVRADVWKQHVHVYAASARYESDWDFLNALYLAGVPAVWCDVVFSRGGVSRGAAEGVCS
jgi:hypothetical protein